MSSVFLNIKILINKYFSAVLWDGIKKGVVSMLAEKMEKLSYMMIEGTVKCSEPLTLFFLLPLIYSTLKHKFLETTLYLMRFIPQITSFQGKHVAAQQRSGISHLNN